MKPNDPGAKDACADHPQVSLASPFFQTLSAAFWGISGYDLDLVQLSGGKVHSCFNCVRNNQCRALLKDSCSRADCFQFLSRLTQEAMASEESVSAVCHAGFRNTVIPLDRSRSSRYFLLLGRKQCSTAGEMADAVKLMEVLQPTIRNESIVGAEFSGKPISSLSDRVRDFIQDHYAEPLRLADIAHQCGVSPYHMEHRFSSEMGVPVMTFLRHFRLEKACEQLLLNSRKTVAEICFEVGFQSVSQFNRAFRSYTGMSPTGYRKSVQT